MPVPPSMMLATTFAFAELIFVAMEVSVSVAVTDTPFPLITIVPAVSPRAVVASDFAEVDTLCD